VLYIIARWNVVDTCAFRNASALRSRFLKKLREEAANFGCWFADDAGLTAYEYTLALNDPRAATFTKQDGEGGSTDHWYQTGNLRIKAMLHADGRVRVLDSTRGPEWVSEYSEFEVRVNDIAIPKSARRRSFGMGYGQYVADRSDIRATRTVYAPFGSRGDVPALIIEYTFVNSGATSRNVAAREPWDATISPPNVVLTQAVSPGSADSERDAFMAQFDQSANFEPARSAITLDTFLRFDVPSGIAEWRVELPAGARALIRERRNSSRARASTRAERGFPKAARPFARPW
jgi:hypothetical protein